MNEYNRRARLYPALIVALPLSLGLVLLGPTHSQVWVKAGSLVGASGLPLLVAQWVRSSGRRVEAELYGMWGGAPTTILLRHASTQNAVALARRHGVVESAMGDVKLPSSEEERRAPQAADQVYETVTQFLRERTRDSKTYPALFDELCSYGFRRNMFALRAWGLAICAAAAVFLIADVMIVRGSGKQVAMFGVVTEAVIIVVAGALWKRLVTRDWVHEIAFAYAERLIAASDLLA